MGNYLCPNDLILGKSNVKGLVGQMGESATTGRRLEFIDRMINSFWKKWQRDYFPTLLVRQKWHVTKRNMKVGDIVLVQDSNVIRGKWKLGQVVNAEPGRDGMVRDVQICYRTQKQNKEYEIGGEVLIKRSVHRLIVLLPIEEQV